MSKPVKVEDNVYSDLDRLRVGRQTFSDVIRGLLDTRLKVFELLNVMEGQIAFRARQIQELEESRSK